MYHKIMDMQKKGQKFTEDEVLVMFVQIAMGLAHVHQKKILHRDLKTQVPGPPHHIPSHRFHGTLPSTQLPAAQSECRRRNAVANWHPWCG